MKKILILGAGFLQSFIIKKAKEIGYYTIAIDKNPNAVGFLYADEHEVIDIIDREACLKYARLKNIDGVITVATDYGVLSSAYIAEQMNLPGLRYEIAKAIKNKYLVRRILFENKIDDISQYFEINSKEDLTNLRTKIKFPVIVKPCDGSGSKGVRRVDSFNELEEAYIEAMNISLIKKVLIEEFVEGKEYGVEAFVYNGEIYVLGVIEKYMTTPPCYAELGHALPNDLTMEEENKIREVVKKAIRALGINFGAVNMDLLFTKDKRVCIVDVGARMGGNLIGSHIIQYGSGINYMDVLIRAAMGESINLEATAPKLSIVTRILALKPGKIIELPNINEIKKRYDVEIYHWLKVGNVIRKYENNLDGCGYVVAISNNKHDAVYRAEIAKQMIDEGIIRN